MTVTIITDKVMAHLRAGEICQSAAGSARLTSSHYVITALASTLAATILLAAGCLTPAANSRPPSADDPTMTLWVVDHGWHTSIVVRRIDVDRALWSELDDVSDAALVEVAWGDRDFYMAKSPTSGLAIKAALVTTGSVLHVVGFTVPVTDYFAGLEVVAIRLSRRSFDALASFVHAEYQRDRDGAPRRLGRSLYGSGWFYAAHGRYHLFNTCNTWIARALSTAGLAVEPVGVVTASDVMRQVRPIGETRPPG
jgi:uncharacterized protein (TIGR02117 family)